MRESEVTSESDIMNLYTSLSGLDNLLEYVQPGSSIVSVSDTKVYIFSEDNYLVYYVKY